MAACAGSNTAPIRCRRCCPMMIGCWTLTRNRATSKQTMGRVILVAAVVATLTGCGGSGNTVRVSGQLIKDGKPYTADLSGKEPETFAVDFVGTVDGNLYVFPATINSSGAFSVDGPDRQGIPRGQYKVAVLHSGYMGAGGDRFGARFAAEKTPLAVDVKENAKLTIDLGAGTVG